MVRIAVIDDERPARGELRLQISSLLPEAVIEEGDSGAMALTMAGEKDFDLFFLDINLGDIQGTVLANAIKKMQPEAGIVFVTAYSEYAVKAFELEVDDYIMKPFDKKRLKQALDKCLALHHPPQAIDLTPMTKTAQKRVAINSAGKTIFEDVKNIIYIETYNRGCKIYTRDTQYCDNRKIGEYEKILGNTKFFRIHKSYLINLEMVREVFPWGNNAFSLRMKGYDDNILPIGRDKTKLLRQMLER